MSPTLIVLTSFYPAAQQAVRYADAVASAIGSRVVLLHVDRVSLFDPYTFAGPGWERRELTEDREMATLLAAQARQLRATASEEIATDLTPELARDLAARHHPAVFVLGRPAAEHLRPDELSTAAGQMLRAMELPLLLVPLGTTAPAPPRQVLLAADSEAFALPGLAEGARQLLQHLGAELTVAHVSEREDDRACTGALEAVRRSGLVAGISRINLLGAQHQHPADGVLAASSQATADLVVVLARSHSYLGELFHRSVTAAVASRSTVPVLIVPAAEPALPRPQPPRVPADEYLLWPKR